jgi:hypothetical protein
MTQRQLLTLVVTGRTTRSDHATPLPACETTTRARQTAADRGGPARVPASFGIAA